MPNPDAAGDPLYRFLTARTWAESRRILSEHPELTDSGPGTITILLSQDLTPIYPGLPPSEAASLLLTHRHVLMRCRQVGVSQAIAEVEGLGASGRRSLETERTSPRRANDAYRTPPDSPHRGWLIFAVAAVLAIAGIGTFVPMASSLPSPFPFPTYLPDTAPSPVGVATTGLGDIVGGLTGALAEVAVYPRAVPVAHLIKHYRLVETV